MKTLTFNKGNWSGEKITIEVNPDGTFVLYDETFQITSKNDNNDDPTCYATWTEYDIRRVGDEYPIVTGAYFTTPIIPGRGLDTFVDMDEAGQGGAGINRDQEINKWESVGEAALVAGVQVLCNII